MDEIPDIDPTFTPTDAPTSIFTKKAGGSTRQPRSDQPPKDTAATARGRKSKHDERKKKVLSLLGTVGSAVMFFENYDGQVILMQAEELAEATSTLADEVPAVAKAIDAMGTGGAYGAFLLALASIALPILAHHNLIPGFITTALVPNAPSDDQTNAA